MKEVIYDGCNSKIEEIVTKEGKNWRGNYEISDHDYELLSALTDELILCVDKKPFDYEEWQKNKDCKLITRVGESVRIIAEDAMNFGQKHLVCLVNIGEDSTIEMPHLFTFDGKCQHNLATHDLFFA